MLSEDYVIRLIQLTVAALLKILGLKNSGLFDDALVMIDMAIEQLMGMRSGRVKTLDDERLYFLLTRNERIDTERLALLADLLHEEGDVYSKQNRMEESRADYARALRYYLEVFFQAQTGGRVANQENLIQPDDLWGEVAIPDKIKVVLSKLKPVGFDLLGPETLWPLAGYFEEIGEYASAEDALMRLAAYPGLEADLAPELRAFYERLVELPEDQLVDGGLDSASVQVKLSRFSSQGE